MIPTSERLARAGRLAVANAVVTVPLFLFSLILALDDSYSARVAQAVTTLISTLLFIYVMLTLLDYLNGSYDFHAVDKPVKVLLWINIIVTVMGTLGLLSRQLQEVDAPFAMLLMVPSGAAQAAFGYRLLRLPDPLGGKLKPFCILNLISGISLAVVVAIPLGLLTSVASDFILGRIFLEAARMRPRT
ncbi:hypothetical protein [Geotalea sp. SG265]|uniref:hypothetical protein n=1 Tax=Geotalea sp. SG265 TaxID=2922867 RepID=UPI001FAEAAEC|nr:hypothetical protein [Geotalea sp. SG265]